MTNTPRSDAEQPEDPAVRQLLWRLRARLVTPPDADRAATDLEQLLAAAREHAHPDPVVEAEVVRDLPREERPAAGGLHLVTQEGHLPGPVHHLGESDSAEVVGARRRAVPHHLGRIAAAVVLVVAVGGGAAGARDGQFSLPGPFGERTTPDVDAPIAAADPADSAAGELADAADAAAVADATDADALPELDAVDPAEGVPDVDLDTPPSLDDAEPPADDAAGGDGSGAGDNPGGVTGSSSSDAGASSGASSSGSSGSSSGSGSADAGSSGTSGSSGSSGSGSSGSGSEGSSGADDDTGSGDGSDGVTEEVIAAPPDRNVDGFGGPQPCPDDQDLAACLEERSESQDDAVAEVVEEEDATSDRDADSEESSTSEKDELARRRGSG